MTKKSPGRYGPLQSYEALGRLTACLEFTLGRQAYLFTGGFVLWEDPAESIQREFLRVVESADLAKTKRSDLSPLEQAGFLRGKRILGSFQPGVELVPPAPEEQGDAVAAYYAEYDLCLLKAARAELGLTQAEAMEALGCGRGNLDAWESGKSPVPKHVARWTREVLSGNVQAATEDDQPDVATPSSALELCQSFVKPKEWDAYDSYLARQTKPQNGKGFAYYRDIQAAFSAGFKEKVLKASRTRGPECIITTLPILAVWRFTRGIYRFDPDLAAELDDSKIGTLPPQLLENLPEYAPFIELEGHRFHNLEVVGAWVAIFPDRNEASTLMISLLRPDCSITPMIIKLDSSDLRSCVQLMHKDSRRRWEKYGDSALDDFCFSEVAAAEDARMASIVLSRALYLCSKQPDIEGVVKKPRRRKQNQKTYAPEFVDSVITVGERFGGVLREWRAKQQSGSESEAEGEATGKKVAPHVRRGHWHLYWTGEGRKTPEIRWISPVVVGAAIGEDIPAHIREVDEKDS